jgi:hypothetical protein
VEEGLLNRRPGGRPVPSRRVVSIILGMHINMGVP